MFRKTKYQKQCAQWDRIVNHDFPWLWAISPAWSFEEGFLVLHDSDETGNPTHDRVVFTLSERVVVDDDEQHQRKRIWAHFITPIACVEEVPLTPGQSIAWNVIGAVVSREVAHLVIADGRHLYTLYTIICAPRGKSLNRLLYGIQAEEGQRSARRIV